MSLEKLSAKEFIDFDFLCKKYFWNSFVNDRYEYIIWPKHNIYFMLEDVQSTLDLKYKVLNWCSRYCIKGIPERDQKRMQAFINEFLQTNFNYDDFEMIYVTLGNAINEYLTKTFIENDYDLELLKI